MKIGDKVVLHNVMSPSRSISSDKPDQFVCVTISEEKSVLGMWSNKTFTGYKAIGDDNRIYLLNWTSFPDDSITPNWLWTRQISENLPKVELHKIFHENDYEWFDVTQGLAEYIDFRPIWIDKYSDVVEHCAKHSLLYRIENGCFYCNNLPDGHIVPKDHSWLGWK